VRVIRTKEFWRPLYDPKLLRRYERARQADVQAMGFVTDGLQRLFAQPGPVWQNLRNWGMRGFDRSGPLKHWMTQRAMGQSTRPTLPRPQTDLSFSYLIPKASVMKFSLSKLVLIVATIALTCGHVLAQEAVIRKNLSERLPNLPKIDEVSKTPMNGLFEIRLGNDVMYSDAEGNFLIQGALIDTKQKRNLTEERVDKLSVIPFDQLPIKNAFTQVRGNGKRKLVVFADPNCGYCKRFEKDLQKLDNVTIYHFLYPILGEDSKTKTKNIWCAKDKAKVWNDWMINGTTPPAINCDASAIDSIVAFGQKNRITGTPLLLFADGSRVPGAVPMAQVEKMLTEIK